MSLAQIYMQSEHAISYRMVPSNSAQDHSNSNYCQSKAYMYVNTYRTD